MATPDGIAESGRTAAAARHPGEQRGPGQGGPLGTTDGLAGAFDQTCPAIRASKLVVPHMHGRGCHSDHRIDFRARNRRTHDGQRRRAAEISLAADGALLARDRPVNSTRRVDPVSGGRGGSASKPIGARRLVQASCRLADSARPRKSAPSWRFLPRPWPAGSAAPASSSTVASLGRCSDAVSGNYVFDKPTPRPRPDDGIIPSK